MASLIKLKQELQFQTNLAGLLNVLKAIAVQQYQSLEHKIDPNETFFDAIHSIAGMLNFKKVTHPFTQTEGPMGVILVTSDSGLLGGLNQQVVTAAIEEYERKPGELMVIGKRGANYVRERRVPFREFPGIQDDARQTLADKVRDYALNQILAGRLGGLTIVYPKAVSFTVQRVEIVHALPCQEWLKSLKSVAPPKKLLVESPLSSMLETLVWFWVAQKLYEIFGFSRLAELGARSAHLEGSAQELSRQQKKMQQRYFRQRREIIDRNIREVSAARILFAKN